MIHYRKRVPYQRAEGLKLPKLNFPVNRRTNATLARDKGHVKDFQGMMSVSRRAIATEVWMQTLEGGVQNLRQESDKVAEGRNC